MSPRSDGNGDYSDYWQLDVGRWSANAPRVATSKRGKSVLMKLEAALLALPEKKLLADHISDGCGNFCTVGALVAHDRMLKNGTDWVTESRGLWESYDKDWILLDIPAKGIQKVHRWATEGSLHDTAALATENLPITWTLAWILAEQNDYDFKDLTPEERYAQVLTWVREKLAS